VTKTELLTILAFVEKGHDLSKNYLGINEATWNILLYIIRRHLENKLVTMTSLAQAADIPYTSAVRKIEQMLSDGLIIRRVRTSTGRSFSLHPSEAMLTSFHHYALGLKQMIAQSFGFPMDAQGRGNYYFGASYMAANIIAAPTIMRQGIGVNNTLRCLFNDDQTFLILQGLQSDLAQWLGGKVEIDCVPLDTLRTLSLENAQEATSKYDVMSFDLPWIGEYAQKQCLKPLDAFIQEGDLNAHDFQPAGWEAARYNGVQYGVPIEPTPELLFYRKDILEECGLTPPASMTQVLRVLQELKRLKPDIYGIAFCAARGTPIAHMFVQLLGDFGRTPLDLPWVYGDFDLSELNAEGLTSMIDTPAGMATAQYMLALKEFAPPDLLDMAWDEVTQCYSDGRIALGYVWTGRAARFELNPDSPAYHNSGYLPHPTGIGRDGICPMGGYALGIPDNLDAARVDMAWQVTKYLTSPELIKLYVQHGCLVSPRFSVSADPEVKSMSGIIEMVDGLAQKGLLKYWQRPPVPQFSEMMNILGVEIHAMMKGELSPRQALARSHKTINQLLKNGRQSETS